MNFKTWSYRFAEQVLNSKLHLKKEIEDIIQSLPSDVKGLTRPRLNQIFKEKFLEMSWKSQPALFEEAEEIGAKLDFLKEKIGVEVAFSHASFIGIDLLKFQTLSYSNLDKIDAGVYILITKNFQKKLAESGNIWDGSLTFEKVVKYLPHFKSAIQVPIFVIGLEG